MARKKTTTKTEHAIKKIHTLGVYGTSEESFFRTLVDHQVDMFCDIRRRRGLRGSRYKYANSAYLQAKLEELGIKYIHLIDWSPTDDIRAVQKAADKKNGVTQTTRTHVCNAFIDSYRDLFLKALDLDHFLAQVGPARVVTLLCVEQSASACHRSVAAEEVRARLNVGGEDITRASSDRGEDSLE